MGKADVIFPVNFLKTVCVYASVCLQTAPQSADWTGILQCRHLRPCRQEDALAPSMHSCLDQGSFLSLLCLHDKALRLRQLSPTQRQHLPWVLGSGLCQAARGKFPMPVRFPCTLKLGFCAHTCCNIHEKQLLAS